MEILVNVDPFVRATKPEPAWWDEPDLRDALSQRDIGQVFYLLHRRHGLSQRRIAELAGFAASEIHEIIKGRKVMAYDVLLRIADGLGVPRGYMGMASDAASIASAKAASPRCHPDNVRVGRASDVGEDERGALGDAMRSDAAESIRFARRLTLHTIHPIAIDDLHAQVRWLSRRYVSQPLVDLLVDIRQLRADVFTRLEGGHPVDQYRDLYLVAGRLTGLLAHAALDCGDYFSADVHARSAWLCAEYADHRSALAWVRSLQSLIAYWDGRPAEAREYATSGLRYACADANEVRLHSLQGRACAAIGDSRGALDALTAATSCGERHDDADHLGGVFSFPPAKRAVYAGTTLLALGGPSHVRQAVVESSHALKTYAGGAAEERSTGDVLAARMDLAQAHVVGRCLDAAHAHVMQVTAMPPHRRTASVVRRVAAFTEELASTPEAASPLGREMVDAGRAFRLTAPALPLR